MSTNQKSINLTGDILIVDDEIANLQLLTQFLSEAGYQVRPAKGPQLAIESALAQPPSLILLDVRMPEMDGFEVCRRLKQEERTRDIPIIFVSALQDVKDRIRGFKAGGVDFISKPFQELEVLARVRTHLALRNMQLYLEDLVAERTAELVSEIDVRKRAEERLRYQATLLENVSDAVVSLYTDYKVVSWNNAAEQIYGWKAEETLGKGFRELTAIEYPDENREELLEKLHRNGFWRDEVIQQRKNGDRIVIQATVSPVKDKNGNTIGSVWVNRDITAQKAAEKELLRARINYRMVADYTYDWEWWKKPDDTFHYVSPACERITGYKADRFIENHSLIKEIIVPEDRDKWDKHDRQSHKDIGRREMQFRIKRPDGEVRWIEHACQPVFTRENEFLGIRASNRDITKRKRAEQKIIDYQQRLKALASQLTIAEEKERHAIAADLHDNVGQSLALARIQLASARQFASESTLAEMLDDISDSLLETLEDTQLLMLELSSPAMNEIGLSSAISEWLEVQIGNRYSLKTEVIDNIPENHQKILDPNVRTLLFRNVKELLINVVKHARANKVSVRLEDRNTSIRIIVEDDGIGFEPRAVIQTGSKIGGFGLFSIEELMADLGGDLKIVSEPGKGCMAILSAPFSVDDSQEGD